MGKMRMALSRKLEGRDLGPPSENARTVRVCGVVSLPLVPAMLGLWLLHAGWLADLVLLAAAVVAAVAGAWAVWVARFELLAISRRHAPASGERMTRRGYLAGAASVTAGLLILLARLFSSGPVAYSDGSGDFKWPQTTYRTWTAAIEANDPIRYASCLRASLCNAELIRQYEANIRQYMARQEELDGIMARAGGRMKEISGEIGRRKAELLVEQETKKENLRVEWKAGKGPVGGEELKGRGEILAQLRAQTDRRLAELEREERQRLEPLDAEIREAERRRAEVGLPEAARRLAREFLGKRALLRSRGLREIAWTKISSGEAAVQVVGGSTPVTVTMVYLREEGGWKIDRID